MFDRILVGVDGTDFGYEALHQALALAPNGASVHAVTALNTAQLVHAGFNMEYFMAQFEEEAERARDRATEIMGDRPNCTAKVVRGDAKDVLRHVCDENEATLVALGGRSSSRFLGMMAGETAGTLLHDAARSVFFARPQWGRRWNPERVVVGLDGSPYSLAALTVADDLAARLGSAIQVVTAKGGKSISPDGEWTERTIWDQGHPVGVLRDASVSVDLLILGSRGLHGLRALGSVSERVAHGAHCSTLVVHTSPPD